jgi:TnpA family transposase
MAAIDRTAYPRLGTQLTAKELEADYALGDEERLFVRRHAHGDAGRLSLAILLKTRHRLGYFVALSDVPDQIRRHVAGVLDLSEQTPLVDEVGRPATAHRYRDVIRDRLGSRPFSHGGRQIVIGVVHRAAQTMSDPADLISASVEALIKERIELPAYSTLDRLVGSLRQEIHEELYAGIDAALNESQRSLLDALLEQPAGAQPNTFSRLKQNPGPPTLKHLREWTERLAELDAILDPRPPLAGIPHTKVRQFAAEAAALETGDLRDVCRPGRRHTLLLCLLHQTQSETRDQLVEMFIRRLRRTRNKAMERLLEMQANQREIEDTLLGVFGQVLQHAGADSDDRDLGRNVRQLLAERGGVDVLDAQFHAVTAFHNDNYLPLMWPIHSIHRSALFRLLDLLRLESSTRDTRLLDALAVVRLHQHSRRDALSVSLDLGFASQRWQTYVRERVNGELLLGRRALELCVFMHLAEALQSGDVFVVGSGAYADYRTQLLPWSDCDQRLIEYGTAVGLPGNASEFVAELRDQLTRLAAQTDADFPDNGALTIDADGTPHLIRQPPQRLPDGLYAFEEAVRTRMPERHLLDVLKHAQHWSSFTRHFGPLSGSDTKLDDATKRYLFAVFGFGCNLGVSQTARHAPESINRHSMRRINAQHVNVEKLEAALKDIIHEYARFDLPHLWGRPNIAIADGTHMELRENNLLGEQHIRYGRYGGIAYHHISATYIALFSNFIACGVWEAVYILDGLLQNRSDFDADTVHADTHGQSEPVFGLAYLLGIELLPRMRTWNDAVFYRPDNTVRYRQIDALFSKTVDWVLIETHWQDMMQVVLSIQAGLVLPSMLLRKLGSHNRQNRLYRAFRELGRVVRTRFLLRFVSDGELRQSIRAETTKIESYNDFLDWVGFGGPVLKSGDPVEQLKQVKYMDLVANAIMLHNVVDLTEVLSTMVAEGLTVTKALVARLSPYMRDHLRRFGQYALDMDELPPALYPKPLPVFPDRPK